MRGADKVLVPVKFAERAITNEEKRKIPENEPNQKASISAIDMQIDCFADIIVAFLLNQNPQWHEKD